MIANFPSTDGCAVCRGWQALSPRDAKGGGSRVVFTARQRWCSFCKSCGRMTGRGVRVKDDIGWNDQKAAHQ